MTELLELTKDFKTSRPIFRLQLDRKGDSIDANQDHPVYKYAPEVIDGNMLSQLVVEHYKESFNVGSGKFHVDVNEIANNAMEEIRRCIARFVENNLDMKAPTQTKLYRWAYRSMPNTTEFNDVLVSLYKYLLSFCNSDMRANLSKPEHTKNTIAFLEAMMEKYDER